MIGKGGDLQIFENLGGGNFASDSGRELRIDPKEGILVNGSYRGELYTKVHGNMRSFEVLQTHTILPDQVGYMEVTMAGPITATRTYNTYGLLQSSTVECDWPIVFDRRGERRLFSDLRDSELMSMKEFLKVTGYLFGTSDTDGWHLGNSPEHITQLFGRILSRGTEPSHIAQVEGLGLYYIRDHETGTYTNTVYGTIHQDAGKPRIFGTLTEGYFLGSKQYGPRTTKRRVSEDIERVKQSQIRAWLSEIVAAARPYQAGAWGQNS
jgi:hypothetical protein